MIEVLKSVFKSVEVAKDGETVRLEVGNKITFSTIDGVVKTGALMDIKKKEEKTELIIQPENEPQQETWKVLDIADDTLELVK